MSSDLHLYTQIVCKKVPESDPSVTADEGLSRREGGQGDGTRPHY